MRARVGALNALRARVGAAAAAALLAGAALAQAPQQGRARPAEPQGPPQANAEPEQPARAEPPARTFAVRAGTLHVGDGSELHDAVLLVADGRVVAVGSGAETPNIPAGTPVVDAADKVVMPGIVAADSDVAGHRDGPYNVSPDFLALDGFDLIRPRPALLAGGVTSIYLSPGRSRLISGQGAVVKTHGDDLLRRVVRESACLRINMGEEAWQAPAVFEPTAAPTADDPLRPARHQLPSARISLLPQLQSLFEQARGLAAESSPGPDGGPANHLGLLGYGAAEDRYAPAPLLQVLRGELPLRIAAKRAADVRRALSLARDLGAALVLEDPWEIEAVAAEAARQHAGAVFRMPVQPGASNPGGEDRLVDAPRSRPENAALAAAAGMTVALAPAADAAMADYLMTAALAIRYGLPPDRAMRAVTGDAAALLGAGDRVGTLRPGRDADLLVLSGPPFAIGTLVEEAWVDGELAYEREADSSMLAVRCGVVHTMAGGTLRDAVILVADGVIKAIGEGLAVPYGARVIDAGDGVAVPGFVDAYSHLGLSGEGSGVPRGAADQPVAAAVRRDDPLLREAARAGLTTVLVSGADGGLVSGRVAALKTAAADGAPLLLKETAAIRLVHDAIGADAIKPLADAIERGRRYAERWKEYEQAMAAAKAAAAGGDAAAKGQPAGRPAEQPAEKPAEGEKPQEPAPETPQPTPEPAPPPAEDPLSGTWQLELVDAPMPMALTLTLRLEGDAVRGNLAVEVQGNRLPPAPLQDGRFADATLTGTVRLGMLGEARITARVATDTMEGEIEGERGVLAFTGRRTEKPEPGQAGGEAGGGEGGAPQRPDVDESLEPLRALVEGRIPAVVRADRAPAIAAVLEWFAAQKLPLVLTGARDAIETPELLGEQPPPVVLGPDVVRRERGETTNAAAVLAERGVPVAFGSGDTAGARYLPLHAALAVRYGMDPSEALKALTIHPAKMFKIDDRVGSLERGKDADFVVFSGNPFELTSRVQLVVVGGEVVLDERESKP